MKKSLFEYKENIATLNEAISKDAEEIAVMAADPSVPIDDIKAKETHRDELVTRRDMLKKQHDELEKKQKNNLENQYSKTGDEKEDKVKAKAAFYKAALTGGDTSKAYEGLGAIPAQNADLGMGDNLLPSTLSNELLTEPFETNSLRKIEPVTNITGLEEAKLDFEIEDADLEDVTDKDTANEIKTEGNVISYGRFKTKISVTIKDTVLHGTPFALASTIENGLRSGLAVKEKMRAFATAPDSTHAHMSFYSTENEIKVVTGSTMYDAIISAWGDLADAFSENATVVMRKIDYIAMIRDLANGSESLFSKKPEEILGIPVNFNDRATKPVVGDFRYSKQNYDIGTIYETDKDAKKGEYYFVLTAWGDHRIRLKSAFRIAEVSTNP